MMFVLGQTGRNVAAHDRDRENGLPVGVDEGGNSDWGTPIKARLGEMLGNHGIGY